jgi:hypothetical protein
MSPMKRIKKSALTTDELGVLRLGTQAYSGLAYVVTPEGGVGSIERVEAGRVTGLSEDWFDLPEGGARVDRAMLEEAGDHGPFLWRGAAMNGIVYGFDSEGICFLEELYKGGLPADEARRAWYVSGGAKQAFEGEEGSSWFEDGRLQSKRVEDKTLFNMVLSDGRLRSLRIEERSLFDITTLRGMGFAEEFFLIGAGIDAGLIAALCQSTPLAKVQQLRLIRTSVGPEVLDSLAAFDDLTALWLEGNPALGSDEADLIRAALADCTVHVQEADDEEADGQEPDD